MIKPAIPYLDLIYQARKITNHPICAYSVSGEYTLIKVKGVVRRLDRRKQPNDGISYLDKAGRLGHNNNLSRKENGALLNE